MDEMIGRATGGRRREEEKGNVEEGRECVDEMQQPIVSWLLSIARCSLVAYSSFFYELLLSGS